MRRSRRSLIVPGLVASILLVTLVLHLPLLNQPFGRDQGIFAYIGQGILQGYVPYRDAWDHKPPGIDFAYALAFGIFGRNMVSVHLLELVGILMVVTILFSLGRRLYGASTGIIAALIYGSGSALMFEWWDRGQAEFLMTLPVALGLYSVARTGILDCWTRSPSTGIRRYVTGLGAGGFFAGLAIYFKPTAGVMLVFLSVMVAATTLSTRTWRRGSIGIVALTIGAIASLIPLIAYFGLNGALGDLYEAVIVFNTYHIQTGANLTLAQMIAATLDFGARMGFIAPLGALGAIFVALRRHIGGITILLWLAFLMAGVWIQGKFFSYHWSTLLAPLSLLATIGILEAWDSLAKVFSRLSPELITHDLPNMEAAKVNIGARVAAITLPVLVFAYGIVLYKDQIPKLGRDLPFFLGSTSEQNYLANFGHNLRGVDVYSFSAAKETARYVADRTEPQDTVLVWGFQALVNFLADRRSPTRYVFNYPLTIDQPDSDLRAQARKTFLEELGRSKPKYIVLVTNDVNPLQAVDSVTLLKGFPELKSIIDNQYVLEKDIADFHVYRWEGSPQ